MDRAVPADSGAAPVDPEVVARAAVVLADEGDSADPVGPAAVVARVVVAQVAEEAAAADPVGAKAVSVDPADPARASAIANVKGDRTFAA